MDSSFACGHLADFAQSLHEVCEVTTLRRLCQCDHYISVSGSKSAAAEKNVACRNGKGRLELMTIVAAVSSSCVKYAS